MKKILFTIDSNTSGGAERVLVTLANSFSKHGYEIFIINADSDSAFYLVRPEIEVHKMGIAWEKRGTIYSMSRMYKKYLYIKNFLMRHKIDVVITFLFNMEIPTILAANSLQVPVISSVRCSLEAISFIKKMIYYFIYKRINGVVFQSEDVRKCWCFKKISHSDIIYNPLENSISKKQNAVKYGSRNNWIVNVGRFVPEKNQMLLIRAFEKVAKLYPEIELHIFGEGPLKNRLSNYINKIADNDISSRIYLENVQKNVIKNNRYARVFVLSSQMEGFPNVLVEAMAYGIPVITTAFNQKGVYDIVKNEYNGFVVQNNDVNALVNMLQYVLDLKANTDEIADRETDIFDRLNEHVITERWELFIQHCIEKGK